MLTVSFLTQLHCGTPFPISAFQITLICKHLNACQSLSAFLLITPFSFCSSLLLLLLILPYPVAPCALETLMPWMGWYRLKKTIGKLSTIYFIGNWRHRIVIKIYIVEVIKLRSRYIFSSHKIVFEIFRFRL